jgi:maltose O-acetyltransferase
MILRFVIRIKNKILLLLNNAYLFFYALEFKKFGKNNCIWFPLKIYGRQNITIGNNTVINSFVHIWGQGDVEIGNNVMIASHVSITSLTHNYNCENMRLAPIIKKRVIIEDDAWIGSGAIILPGIRIGRGAVIGAGSVVTKNVTPLAIVVGNPARVIKWRDLTIVQEC